MKIKEQHMNLICLVTTFCLSIGAVWMGVKNASSKVLGTVDMQFLLKLQSQQLAESFPNGQVPPGVMQQAVEDIKSVIKDFGQDQNITLLAKGAVLSGELPDYTQEIIKESADNAQNQKTESRGRK